MTWTSLAKLDDRDADDQALVNRIRGYGIRRMAEACDVPQLKLVRWMNGTAELGADAVEKVIRVLDTQPE